MNIRDAIALHATTHKHLIGIVPDDELAARIIAELSEDSVDASETYSQSEYTDAVDEAFDSGKDDIREDVLSVLNDREWNTADELAKLVREAVE